MDGKKRNGGREADRQPGRAAGGQGARAGKSVARDAERGGAAPAREGRIRADAAPSERAPRGKSSGGARDAGRVSRGARVGAGTSAAREQAEQATARTSDAGRTPQARRERRGDEPRRAGGPAFERKAGNGSLHRGRRDNATPTPASGGRAPAWEAALPVRRHQQYEAEIVGLSHEGHGVGRVNGFTLFVAGALPGERALVQVEHLKKQYGFARLLRVLEASPDRVEPPCGIYAACGGCQLQHLSYDAQLRAKRQQVIDNLQRIGKLQVRGAAAGVAAAGDGSAADGAADGIGRAAAPGEAGLAAAVAASGGRVSAGAAAAHRTELDAADSGVLVHATLGMSEPWRYRNKAQVPIGAEQGGLVGGFYAQGSHTIVDMDACLIQHEANDAIVAAVKTIGRDLGITAYREDTHTGLLRHVVVKVGFCTGEIMVVLVTNGDAIPREREWIERIRAAVPGVQSICHNINTRSTNVILGDETRVLWGRDVIYDYIGEIRFAISARSFFQVNPVQTEVLYGKALEYAGLTGGETVVDAYCGIGTISLFLAQKAGKVYGVEIVEEAIADARHNAELNGITNVHFEAGPAENVLPAWQHQGIVPDVIVVDPPRKGCDAVLLDTILELKPQRVVYVSCNPSTLARDLRVLEDGGYRTVEVQPVDMFPHTTHVECVIGLQRIDT
uniref:23S rRNA (Uracil(1939)-C(5))-methyltransferase RlmD n=1 Tax=Paenibacillus athensensis TaxID=1967502 RepID=A0A4Y8PZV4_9BACL